MKTLAELEKIAQNDEKSRKFLIIHPKSGPWNGEFLDPFMGVIQIEGINGIVYSNQLLPFETKGIFIDTEDN